MTKQHFAFIADVLRQAQIEAETVGDAHVIKSVAFRFANALK